MLTWVMIPGFVLGAAGSLHCIGMCGPLGLALPFDSTSRSRRFISLLVYNLGRVFTYSVLGFLFGLIGESFYLAGFQQQFSLVMGILLFLLALLYIAGKRFHGLPVLDGLNRYVVQRAGRLMGRISTPAGFFAFGMLNGLLPCGMIYMAIAAALSLASVTESTLFMAFFGLGTLPAMLVFNLTSQLLGERARGIVKGISPVILVLVSVLLIVRGLDFSSSVINLHGASPAPVHCTK